MTLRGSVKGPVGKIAVDSVSFSKDYNCDPDHYHGNSIIMIILVVLER